jgi:hypothetical protein
MKRVDLVNGGAILLGTWTPILNIASSWLWSFIKKVGKGFYLRHNVVCLFCLYWWDPPNWDVSNHIIGLFGKLSRKRGASSRFHGVWTYNVEVFEYWMISSLKIKLNCSWKFRRDWNVPLVLLERSWWAWFNGIYLVIFGLKM